MDRKKRIIFTVSNDISFDRRMQRICGTLSESGYDVLLVGRLMSDSKELADFNFSCKRLRCWFSRGKAFYAELNIRLFFLLLFSRFDIGSAVDLDTALAVLISTRLRGKKSFLDAHEYFPFVPEVERRPSINRAWEKIENVCIPKFDVVYTVSQSIADTYEQQFHRPIGLIRNMPDEETGASPGFDERKAVVIYQGAINEGRGLEEAVKAMRSVDAELWLLGKGDIYESLVMEVSRLGLEEKVRFFGWVDPKDLPGLTIQARVGLNLLENRSKSYYFSLANKFFDYVQAGLPAIHMSFPEYEALNKQKEVCVLLEDLNEELIANSINSLLSDPDKWSGINANCMEARKDWNWQKESQKLIELYEQNG